jgi:hypothetical protein
MRFLFLLFLVFVLISCEKSTQSIENEPTSFYQIPGCDRTDLLFKTGTTDDRCFFYTFDNILKVDLCLPANCCPDSDRFDYDHDVKNGIITFTVVDTADNLCRCTCNYLVHANISGLTEDKYTFNCYYYDSLYYTEQVVRR